MLCLVLTGITAVPLGKRCINRPKNIHQSCIHYQRERSPLIYDSFNKVSIEIFTITIYSYLTIFTRGGYFTNRCVLWANRTRRFSSPNGNWQMAHRSSEWWEKFNLLVRLNDGFFWILCSIWHLLAWKRKFAVIQRFSTLEAWRPTKDLWEHFCGPIYIFRIFI